MLRDVVTSQVVTSLCNLDTEAISPLEYDFLTQTRKPDKNPGSAVAYRIPFLFGNAVLIISW